MQMIGALALVVAAVVAAGCGDHCGMIHQHFILESPDSDLQALVDDCVAGPACTPDCLRPAACLPLCQRVLEIADQFPGNESIEHCFYQRSTSGGGADAGSAPAGEVDVTYRLSSCP